MSLCPPPPAPNLTSHLSDRSPHSFLNRNDVALPGFRRPRGNLHLHLCLIHCLNGHGVRRRWHWLLFAVVDNCIGRTMCKNRAIELCQLHCRRFGRWVVEECAGSRFHRKQMPERCLQAGGVRQDVESLVMTETVVDTQKGFPSVAEVRLTAAERAMG